MLPGFLALMLLSTQVAAVPAAATPTPPNCNAASEYHQLDFWIGDWDTFETDTPSGPSEARTHVDAIAQGCAIHELYEQTDGLIGDSILSYDPVRKQWQQTWVTNRGAIMVIVGNFKDGALVLEGEVHLKDGKSVIQRISWKAQDKGVREWAVLSKDGGKTWAPSFDVLFLKHQRKDVGTLHPGTVNVTQPTRRKADASSRQLAGFLHPDMAAERRVL